MAPSDPSLDSPLLEHLRSVAESVGLLRLGAVSLGHPGLAASADAFEAYVGAGYHGEMDFLARTVAVRRDPGQMLPGARSALVAVAPYGGAAGPIARYARCFDYHTDLHRRLERLATALREARPAVGTLICVDTKPVMERALAALAGVGTLGKNGCLIVPGLGSYVVIGCLLTTAEISTGEGDEAPGAPPDDRARWEVCGSCTLCLEACPTDAFVDAGRLDARRCISYLTIEHRGPVEPELADDLGERIVGCDVCQEVCPHNASPDRGERAPAGAWLQPPPRGERTVDYGHLLTLGSSQHRSFVRNTPLNRIPRRSLRRNALLALGNAGRSLTPEERAAVERCRSDPDAQVRAAAERVLARLGDRD